MLGSRGGRVYGRVDGDACVILVDGVQCEVCVVVLDEVSDGERVRIQVDEMLLLQSLARGEVKQHVVAQF